MCKNIKNVLRQEIWKFYTITLNICPEFKIKLTLEQTKGKRFRISNVKQYCGPNNGYSVIKMISYFSVNKKITNNFQNIYLLCMERKLSFTTILLKIPWIRKYMGKFYENFTVCNVLFWLTYKLIWNKGNVCGKKKVISLCKSMFMYWELLTHWDTLCINLKKSV